MRGTCANYADAQPLIRAAAHAAGPCARSMSERMHGAEDAALPAGAESSREETKAGAGIQRDQCSGGAGVGDPEEGGDSAWEAVMLRVRPAG